MQLKSANERMNSTEVQSTKFFHENCSSRLLKFILHKCKKLHSVLVLNFSKVRQSNLYSQHIKASKDISYSLVVYGL